MLVVYYTEYLNPQHSKQLNYLALCYNLNLHLVVSRGNRHLCSVVVVTNIKHISKPFMCTLILYSSSCLAASSSSPDIHNITPKYPVIHHSVCQYIAQSYYPCVFTSQCRRKKKRTCYKLYMLFIKLIMFHVSRTVST